MDLAFKTIRRALLEAQAVALPDIQKPFHLYVDRRKRVAKGVLAQTLVP